MDDFICYLPGFILFNLGRCLWISFHHFCVCACDDFNHTDMLTYLLFSIAISSQERDITLSIALIFQFINR